MARLKNIFFDSWKRDGLRKGFIVGGVEEMFPLWRAGHGFSLGGILVEAVEKVVQLGAQKVFRLYDCTD